MSEPNALVASVVAVAKKDESFSARDVVHAVALRYAKPVFNIGLIGSAFALPLLAPFNLAQRIVYYSWYTVPAWRDVGELRSYWAKDTQPGVKHASISEISGRLLVSTSFMISVVYAGRILTGQSQLPFSLSPFGNILARCMPSLVVDGASRVKDVVVSELSPSSLKFLGLNSICALSYLFHFINLRYYLGNIPKYLREAFKNVRLSAIALAKLRKEEESNSNVENKEK